MREENTEKKHFFGTINRKMSFLILIPLILTILLVVTSSLFQLQITQTFHSHQLIDAENTFNSLVENNTETLFSSSRVFTENKEAKTLFLEKNREKLYSELSGLFNELKENFRITHFYFILPNGEVFLRMHAKDNFGDTVTRQTFYEARDSGGLGSGMELGKTAFALRAVRPYYLENELIGYVELGEEIDHLIDELKGITKNEYLVIAKKENLDEENWGKVRENANLRNNWNDLENYLILTQTNNGIENLDCVNESNIEKLLNEEPVFEDVYFNELNFTCSGFVLHDASNNNAAVIFTLIDATETASLMTMIRIAIISILAIIILSLLFILNYISKNITKPITELSKLFKKIEKNNFESRADINTNDELEELGKSFNRASKALEKMDVEHKQLEHAKTEFLSITSHELRSPMTPMKAQLQMLLGGYFGKLKSKQKDSIDIVLRNTSRLDNIIVDFLEISRIEAARLKFNFVKIDLTATIKRLVEEMTGFMPEKKIEIITNIGKLPEINVDPDRTMQVLRNLINNAKKFSPNKSKLFVNVFLEGQMIKFSVKDQGIGLAPENKLKIFEPFFQADQTMYERKGGTGLGLSISKGIVESQNGKIWIKSEKGKGTTFFFTIPLIPVKDTKPIKILFSQQQNNESKIKKIMLHYLGPFAEPEFKNFATQTIDYARIVNYFKYLKEKGIITDSVFKDAIKDITELFEPVTK